jgi:diguanylate cyclase (GGDEF)-like protein
MKARALLWNQLFMEYRALVLTALVVIALNLGVIWTNKVSEEQGLDELRRETSALALLFATHTDLTFRTVDLALSEFRNHVNDPPAALTKAIRPHIELLPSAIIQIALINKEGLVTYSTPIDPQPNTLAKDREFFTFHQASTTDQLFVGRPIMGRVSGKWAIPLSRPILVDGKFSGVVLITIDPDYFVNFYKRAGLGKDGAGRMIRDSGEVMARSSEQEKFIGKVINPSPYADPGAPIQGSFRRRAQVDGVDRLSSYHRLPQYALTVVIGPGVDERLAPLRQRQFRLTTVAAVVSLLLLLFATLLYRSDRGAEAAHMKLAEQYEEIVRLKESLSYEVLHDPLTQLNNRRYMEEMLPREIALARREGFPIALAMIDLDFFKRVNDTYGHGFGDLVLKTTASVLLSNARESDLVFRYGGEEFLMIFTHTTGEQAMAKLDQIRRKIETTEISHGEVSVSVTMSAGIATFPTHGASSSELLKRADDALYIAKREGRNRIELA